MKKTWLWIVGGAIILIAGYFLWVWFALGDDAGSNEPRDNNQDIASFDECVEAGNPVMESYPRQCRTEDGRLFVEDIPDSDTPEAPQSNNFTSEKGVAITLDFTEGQTVSSPFTLSGEVPGSWSFEADFPVEIVDARGGRLVIEPATLQGDWMTDNLVPFTVDLEFPDQPPGGEGQLILHKDNPSGESENDDRLTLDVTF